MLQKSFLAIKNPWVVLLFLGIAYSFGYFHRISPMVISLDIMESLNADTSALGLISSANLLGYSLGMIPIGLLADYYGGKKVLIYTQVLAGICGLIFAFSTSVPVAVFARFFMGLLLICNIPALKILANWFKGPSFTTASSIFIVFYVFATFLAGTPLAYTSMTFGWRYVMAIASLVTLSAGILAAFLINNYPEKATKCTEKEEKLSKEEIYQGLKNTQLWLLIIWVTIIIGNYNILSTMWWGVFLLQGWGLDKESVGTSLSLLALVPIPSYAIYTFLAEKIFSYRTVMIFSSILGSCVFGAIAFLDMTWGYTSLTIAGILSVASFSVDPIYIAKLKNTIALKYFGTYFGLMYAIAHFYPVLGQNFFAYILSKELEKGVVIHHAYSNAFIFIFITFIIACIICLFMKAENNSSKEVGL